MLLSFNLQSTLRKNMGNVHGMRVCMLLLERSNLYPCKKEWLVRGKRRTYSWSTHCGKHFTQNLEWTSLLSFYSEPWDLVTHCTDRQIIPTLENAVSIVEYLGIKSHNIGIGKLTSIGKVQNPEWSTVGTGGQAGTSTGRWNEAQWDLQHPILEYNHIKLGSADTCIGNPE